MTTKFFSNKSIGLATYLGGPLAGGILIAINLKRIDEVSKAVWTLIFSLVTTTLMFFLLMEIPEEIIDKIPNALIPLVYTPLIVWIGKYLQGNDIQQTLAENENREHWWKALVVGLVGTLLTIIIIVILAMGTPLFPGEKITYGPVQNEIYISEGTEEKYADIMYDNLADLGYFHDEFAQSAYLEKGENSYTIILYMDQSYWNDSEITSSLTAFKLGMEAETGKKVLLFMRHADLSGEKDKLLE